MISFVRYCLPEYCHSILMSQRPPTKFEIGMSKVGLDSEIGISKSNFLLDGRYRDTFPLILSGVNPFGKTIVIPNFETVIIGF